MALPIHWAAKSGDVEEVKKHIIQDFRLVNAHDPLGFTPLHYTSDRGHVSVLKVLLDCQAAIDPRDNVVQVAPLFVCCKEGHLPAVEYLLSRGSDPSLGSFNHLVPLHIASHHNRIEVVRCLVHHHGGLSTINYRNDKGETPLWSASERGHARIVRVLLLAGADPMIGDECGRTPMDMARSANHDDCVMLLEEWMRSYALTKARWLYDAHRDHYAAAPTTADDGPSKRARLELPLERRPTWLVTRLAGGGVMPSVEMDTKTASKGEGVGIGEEGSVVGAVLEHVVCGGLKGDVFVDLMEMMGRTGYRDQEGDKKGEEHGGGEEEEEDGEVDDNYWVEDFEEEEEGPLQDEDVQGEVVVSTC